MDDKTLLAAITIAYNDGWEEAWAAQRLVVEMLIDAWQTHFRGSGSVDSAKAILRAINVSEAKAKEVFGTPKYCVARVPIAAPEGPIQ